MSAEQAAANEKQRLISLLFDCHISTEKIEMLDSVIENTAWMKAKLDEARELIRDASVAIPYDNGGGQAGIRENPLFKGYHSLWKSYITGLNVIMATLPANVVSQTTIPVDEPKTVLQLVRDKHKKRA